MKTTVGMIVDARENVDGNRRGVSFFCQNELVENLPHNTVLDFGKQGLATYVLIKNPRSGKISQGLNWELDRRDGGPSITWLYPGGHTRFEIISLPTDEAG
jgi:hypothetical protein